MPIQPSEQVCHTCGTVTEHHCATCEQLSAEIENWQDQLAKEMRRVRTLERKLDDVRAESPNRTAAERIFQTWLKATGRDKNVGKGGKPRTTFTDDRLDAVLKMLKQLPEDRIVHAVLWVAGHPYQLFAKHVAEPHRSATKRDDLAYVCAKGSKVEAWAELWEASQ